MGSERGATTEVLPERDMLAVTDLAVRFGPVPVFSGLSFRVPRGSALAIVGANGAGKTVLLRALMSLLPSTGTIRWAPDARVGYVPQKLDLARDIPVTGNDFLAARLAVGKLPRTRVRDVLATVGLSGPVAQQPIGSLSGGQFQRLLVAFALAGEPNVLLLDEPTAGIDEPGQERLNELVVRLQRDQGLTVILISHDLSVVYRHASAVLCLGRSRHWLGTPREVLTQERLSEIYGEPIKFHVHES